MDKNVARRWARWALAATFVAAGLNHFANPRMYEAIMPPALPAAGALVFWSGVAEVVGGLAVLPRRTRRAAGWGLVALLLAIFPANLNMALHPDRFATIPPALLYARLPFQGLFIAWALWATQE